MDVIVVLLDGSLFGEFDEGVTGRELTVSFRQIIREYSYSDAKKWIHPSIG